jgi:transposase
VYIVLEITGHYHRALLQYLQELEIPVFTLHVQKRQEGLLKSDKRDALGLGNRLYNQLDKGIQVGDPLQAIRRLAPPTDAAAQLRGIIQHRYELTTESIRRKNKLTAICDELFPEFTQICHDPNLPTALSLRTRFPTPAALATASLSALHEARGAARVFTDTKLQELQELAAHSIGTKDPARQRGLVFEQDQLIAELILIQQHLAQLDAEITRIVAQCREGQIVTSIPGIGPTQAAAIIASIGNIANFARAAQLKAYFGWAPRVKQSGSSVDYARLTPGGQRRMKTTMYLAVWTAIQRPECEWAKLYQRLVPLKCGFNERTRQYTGRAKVMGRIAGQMIALIFVLLKRDAETLRHLPTGARTPEPALYDPALHHRHRTGHYRPALQNQRGHDQVLELPPH